MATTPSTPLVGMEPEPTLEPTSALTDGASTDGASVDEAASAAAALLSSACAAVDTLACVGPEGAGVLPYQPTVGSAFGLAVQ